MGFTSPIKTYYIQGSGLPSSGNQLVPSPLISLDQEYYYANDLPVGYTYKINLEGNATSLDTRTYTSGTLGFVDVLSSIKNIKNIFNGNNGTLLILDTQDNLVLKATGGTVRNLQFSESDNMWVNYAPFTAEIEFNEVQLANCSGSGYFTSCDSLPSGITNVPELLDMKKYRIKSFNDSWNFDLSDNIYNSYDIFHNEYITARYTIKAEGKHYFIDDKLIPSWEQAKNFVQHRLKNQAQRLIGSVLRRTSNSSGCTTDGYTLETVFATGLYGLLDGLENTDFGIYNEKVSCEASESEGSFSATYDCLIKRKITDNPLTDPDVLHTFTTKTTVSDDTKRNITINIDGNIQGLIPGGLTTGITGVFSLPNSGQFLLNNLPSSGKYDYALNAYNKIGNSTGLSGTFLDYLGITYAALEADVTGCVASGSPPHASHSLSHNYGEGTISYSTSFNTDRACSHNSPVRNLKISIQDATPVIREFIVPGRSGGPIIQRLNVNNPKRITMNMDGYIQYSTLCCPNNISGIVEDFCNDDYFITNLPPAYIPNLKLTSNKTTVGKDGSFSISRSYICCDS